MLLTFYWHCYTPTCCSPQGAILSEYWHISWAWSTKYVSSVNILKSKHIYMYVIPTIKYKIKGIYIYIYIYTYIHTHIIHKPGTLGGQNKKKISGQQWMQCARKISPRATSGMRPTGFFSPVLGRPAASVRGLNPRFRRWLCLYCQQTTWWLANQNSQYRGRCKVNVCRPLEKPNTEKEQD